MNKRTAIALAGGVTGALVTAVAGYSHSLQREAPASVATKPMVRTEVRTITIHRKAKPTRPATAPVHTVIVHRAPTPRSTSTVPAVHHTGGSAHHHEDDEGESGDD